MDGKPGLPTKDRVSKTVTKIGAKAKVRVDARKTASAHDLRRAFGERWAAKLMPAQLMELMRHESIDTTLSYYVGRNAERTAAILWESMAQQPDTVGGAAVQPPRSDVGDVDLHAAAPGCRMIGGQGASYLPMGVRSW